MTLIPMVLLFLSISTTYIEGRHQHLRVQPRVHFSRGFGPVQDYSEDVSDYDLDVMDFVKVSLVLKMINSTKILF